MLNEQQLNQQQIEHYREYGWLVVPGAVSAARVAQLRAVADRLMAGAAGRTANDDVYDLEDGHTPAAPRVRRIKLPHNVDAAFWDLARSAAITGPLKPLIGPNIRLNTSKLNVKAAGYGAAIEWHQDWAFYPHTNDDILAVGVFLDDVDEANGPTLLMSGTHRGPIYSHHRDGMFCGAIDPAACDIDFATAVRATGPAGSLSIHHVRLVHGAAVNRSDRQRRFVFYECRAADAWPLRGVDDLDAFNALMLCGEPTLEPRLAPVPVRMPMPGYEKGRSIYQVQRAAGARFFDDAPARATT